MPTAPTPITPYATPPSSSDPANFDARADAKVLDDAAKVTEYNALAGNVYGNAVEAVNAAAAAAASKTAADADAASAAASASLAAALIGAPVWSAVTVYNNGDPVYSTVSKLIYRRQGGTGAGGSDPSANPANWVAATSGLLQQVTVTSTSATLGANTETNFTNGAAWSATVPALGMGDVVVVHGDNGRRDNTVDLGARSFIGPNGVAVSGVITLNVTPYFAARWWGDYYRSY